MTAKTVSLGCHTNRKIAVDVSLYLLEQISKHFVSLSRLKNASLWAPDWSEPTVGFPCIKIIHAH